jgi:putative SOS response-associated peptidase YedK
MALEEAAQGAQARDVQRADETVATEPMFRDAFKRHRCLIPASGYGRTRRTASYRISSRRAMARPC